MTGMEISYDTEADAMFVWFRDRVGTVRTSILDDFRFVHHDDEGIVGVEFIEVSSGINLDVVPRADEIREALAVFATAA